MLTVLLQKGSNLLSADSNGLSDPYVNVVFGKAKVKSEVIKKTLNPEWNEQFEFPLKNSGDKPPLEFEVRDKDMMTTDFLGAGTLTWEDLGNGESRQYDITLTNAKGEQDKDRGTIHVLITYVEPEEKGEALLNTENTSSSSSASGLFKSLRGAVSGKSSSSRGAASDGEPAGPARRITVEVIRARNLICMDSNGKSDPFVVLQMGKHKQRTRVVYKNLDPEWKQRFEFRFNAMSSKDSLLKVSMYDRDSPVSDDFMGDISIDVNSLPLNVAVDNWYTISNCPRPSKKGLKKNQELRLKRPSARTGEGPGDVHLLITVSDLFSAPMDPEQKIAIQQKSTAWLKVHVIEACNLEAKDVGGSSDPYVTVRVGNTTLRTQTIPKTLNPKFDSLIEIPVKDIFDVVEICVFDEDKGGGSSDFIGAIVLPLLDIPKGTNSKWYALKTQNFLGSAKKGSAICIAFQFTYKKPMAYLGLIKRRELRHIEDDPPFSSSLLKANANRVKVFAVTGLQAALYADGLLKWQHSDAESIGAYVGWLVGWFFVEIWMLPFFSGLAMLGLGIKLKRTGSIIEGSDEIGQAVVSAFNEKKLKRFVSSREEVEDADEEEEEEEEGAEQGEEVPVEEEEVAEEENPSGKKKKKKEKTPGMMAQYKQLQAIGRIAQNAIGDIADNIERVGNLVNWSIPMISFLFSISLILLGVVMFFVPFRYLAMLWGTNKFIRKGLQKNYARLSEATKSVPELSKFFLSFKRPEYYKPINEAVEALNRLPSNVELITYKELELSESLASFVGKPSPLIEASNQKDEELKLTVAASAKSKML